MLMLMRRLVQVVMRMLRVRVLVAMPVDQARLHSIGLNAIIMLDQAFGLL